MDASNPEERERVMGNVEPINASQEQPEESQQGAKRDTSFRLISVADAMKDIAPIEWLINKYLPYDGIVELFGPSGHFKTFSAMGIACSVASGVAWCGEEVKQGSVIYIAGEGNNYLMRRTKAWCIENDVDPENLHMVVSTRSMGLTDIESIGEVINRIDAYVESHGEIPKLAVIDTLARNFGSGDENSTQDMNLLIKHSEHIMAHFPGMTILLIHHTGLSATDRSRGSSALYAALDAQYKCSVEVEGSVQFECTKMKDAAKPDGVVFSTKIVEIGLKEHDGSEATSVILEATGEMAKKLIKTTEREKLLLSMMHEAFPSIGKLPSTDVILDKSNGLKVGQKALSRQALKEFVQKKGGLTDRDNRDTEKTAFNRTLRTLRSKQFIGVSDDWLWLRDKRDKAGQS